MENVVKEHNRFEPVSWWGVLLTAIPGLLMAFTRQIFLFSNQFWSILWYGYLVLLVLVVPYVWWRNRQFPVWALLPVGALVWFVTLRLGGVAARLLNASDILGRRWVGIDFGIAIMYIALALALFLVSFRAQRMPRFAWLLIGALVFGNFLIAVLFSLVEFGVVAFSPGILTFFTISGVGPLASLMLVAVGLLPSRQHGVLALLVMIGGYSYMILDTDFLFGYPSPELAGLPVYFFLITILYLVVMPVALLRARTQLSRALAVFVPVVIFHFIRIVIPTLVVQQSIDFRLGEIVLSINILLAFLLGWILYDHIGRTSQAKLPGDYPAAVAIRN